LGADYSFGFKMPNLRVDLTALKLAFLRVQNASATSQIAIFSA
jgi:hypothetical protein